MSLHIPAQYQATATLDKRQRIQHKFDGRPEAVHVMELLVFTEIRCVGVYAIFEERERESDNCRKVTRGQDQI